NWLSEILPDIDAFNNIHPHFDDDPLSGSTTYSANSLLEEFMDELALITYPPDYDDNLQFDIEVDDLPSPDNEDKVFNPGILFHEKSVTIITRVAQITQIVKLLSLSFIRASHPQLHFGNSVSKSYRLTFLEIPTTASRFNRDAVVKENILDNRLGRDL
nr:hypothetical protein [Tanacetum cinerariifolium]